MYDYGGSTVLITGASRGIGTELAREAARRGASTLVLVARAEDELQRLAEELSRMHDLHAEVIALDLTREDAPQALKAECDRRGLTVDVLVNNAGYGSYGFFDGMPPQRERGMVNLNVAALVELTSRFLPDMVVRNRGGVLNVSSTAAFQPVPFMATYGATKAFVQSFTEAIWAENQERGGDLRITALCPGPTESHFGENIGGVGGKFGNRTPMPATEVARTGWDAWERNQAFAIVGTANYLGTLGSRLMPRAALDRVTASFFRPADLVPNSERARRARNLAVGAAALGTIAAVLVVRARRG